MLHKSSMRSDEGKSYDKFDDKQKWEHSDGEDDEEFSTEEKNEIQFAKQIKSKNRLETMVQGLSKNGMNIEFKRQMGCGEYENATAKDLSLLSSKASIATVAQQIQHLSEDEKLKTALELKNQGNDQYRNHNYEEALKIYLQALSASNFGNTKTNPNVYSSSNSPSSSSEDDGNINTLIVPVLGNMSACCLQLKEYVKVVKFCEQIVQLRPNNFKANLRKGISFYYLKEYELSLESLKKAKTILDSQSDLLLNNMNSSKNDIILSKNKVTENNSKKDNKNNISNKDELNKTFGAIDPTDISKLDYFLIKCRNERLEEKERLKKQKLSLQKAFATGPYAVSTTASSDTKNNMNQSLKNNEENPKTVLGTLYLLIWVIVKYFIQEIKRMFTRKQKIT